MRVSSTIPVLSLASVALAGPRYLNSSSASTTLQTYTRPSTNYNTTSLPTVVTASTTVRPAKIDLEEAMMYLCMDQCQDSAKTEGELLDCFDTCPYMPHNNRKAAESRSVNLSTPIEATSAPSTS
ncbi:MAG: hypothetical protein MMC23_007497 [Stictis urceolatum]|nr:hypothetical protein [Stictis urceolata]